MILSKVDFGDGLDMDRDINIAIIIIMAEKLKLP